MKPAELLALTSRVHFNPHKTLTTAYGRFAAVTMAHYPALCLLYATRFSCLYVFGRWNQIRLKIKSKPQQWVVQDLPRQRQQQGKSIDELARAAGGAAAAEVCRQGARRELAGRAWRAARVRAESTREMARVTRIRAAPAPPPRGSIYMRMRNFPTH
ncbi:hypothetical protein EVAR_102114_1 [Eumeta japonica]|uniref:Uncharacterized protein n=1 Tax=Eumeta variegata TaxID=151549 RepID=A0A4C1U159_EUMVA|nr:hypothetical protein EVAR_102114_1 [Eumeta japonica]